VSTVRQGERGVSLPEQREAIERYAARNNLAIPHWFEERETAAKRGRPIWNEMLKQLRRGTVDGVIIHKIDRSARNLKDWADLGELIDQGIEVHFANEALDLNSRGGRLSADIQAVVAADYIRNLREEARKGFYGRLKQGLYPMRAPVGYLDQGAGRSKIVDPVRGPLIRKAFEFYASGKFTIIPLVEELYRLGLRNLTGGKVSRNGLSTILNNPFYIGLMRLTTTGEVYEGSHEPLISKSLFDDVQDMLSGRFASRTIVHDFAFRRFVACKHCGYSLIGELQKGRVYYRCHTRTCPTTSIREDSIRAAVEGNLRKLTFNEREKAYLATRIQELKGSWVLDKEKQITSLNIKLQQVAERLKRLTDAFVDGAVEREIYDERKAACLFEKRAIEEQLNNSRLGSCSLPDTVQKFLELAESAYSLYQTPITEKKRRLLTIVTSNCTADQKSIDFAFAIPFNEIANRNIDTDGRASKGIHRTLNALLDRLTALIKASPKLVALVVPEDPLEPELALEMN
jgi:site-specific DNA recombinase